MSFNDFSHFIFSEYCPYATPAKNIPKTIGDMIAMYASVFTYSPQNQEKGIIYSSNNETSPVGFLDLKNF